MLGGKNLDIVDRYRYLGVSLAYNLDRAVIMEELSKAASRALGAVVGKTRDNTDLSYSSYSALFHGCVVPILDYASGAWSLGMACDKLESIQMRALHFYMGTPKLSSTLGLIGDSGWTPGAVHRDLNTLRLYNEIVRMSPERLTRQIYEYDRENNPGVWYTNVGAICRSIGETANWLDNKPVSITSAKAKLLLMYEKAWKEEMEKSPKLYLYKEVKGDLGVAPHLKVNLSKKRRSLISQLRLGCLPIAIERDRYLGLPRENRLCPLCRKECESEIHFTLVCEKNCNRCE